MSSQRKRRLKKIADSKELLEGVLLIVQAQIQDMHPFWRSLYYLVALAKKARGAGRP